LAITQSVVVLIKEQTPPICSRPQKAEPSFKGDRIFESRQCVLVHMFWLGTLESSLDNHIDRPLHLRSQ